MMSIDHDKDHEKSHVIADWALPPSLSQPVPRRVKMTGTWLGLIILIAIVFSLPLATLTAAVFGVAHEMNVLEKRGVDIAGTVVELSAAIEGHGRDNRGPLVFYTYEPKEYAHKPDYLIHDARVTSQGEYRSLRVGGTVAVVYDPLFPEHSQLKSRVDNHRLHNEATLFPPVFLIIVLPPIGIIAVMLGIYYREERLLRWGSAVKATIIGEAEFESRGRKMTRAIYTFEDDSGVTVQGEKSGFAKQDDPRPDFVRYRRSFLDNPTAVYDPRNSARNMLYPGGAAQLKQ